MNLAGNASAESVKAHLHNELREEIDHQFSRGRVLSTLDVGYFLDHVLEVCEDAHGDCIPEEEFETFVNATCDELLKSAHIYRAGDRDNYIKNVRELGLIARQEATMRKSILRAKADPSQHRTIFRDTEFPYNADTGMYIV